MSGSGREDLLDVWEWSGGPPGCPRVGGRISWMSGNGQEAFLVVREWSRVPPGCPGVAGRPSLISGSGGESLTGGQDDFPDIR